MRINAVCSKYTLQFTGGEGMGATRKQASTPSLRWGPVKWRSTEGQLTKLTKQQLLTRATTQNDLLNFTLFLAGNFLLLLYNSVYIFPSLGGCLQCHQIELAETVFHCSLRVLILSAIVILGNGQSIICLLWWSFYDLQRTGMVFYTFCIPLTTAQACF